MINIFKNSLIIILKRPYEIRTDMENYISIQRDITDTQLCDDLLKTHRTPLKAAINGKNGSYMYSIVFSSSVQILLSLPYF